MSVLIQAMVVLCLLSTYANDLDAEPNQPISSVPALPMLMTTVGQTQVILHDMQPDHHHVVLEIRSPDVASLPSRSTLHVSFDAPIAHLNETRASVPLQVETAITGRQITFFLARDPFAWPQPWSYTVTIAFHRLPQTAVITLGNLPPQQVTLPSPLPAVREKTLPGTFGATTMSPLTVVNWGDHT